MRVARRAEEIRALVSAERRAGRSIGLVPTMGALHAGHLSLVRLAHERCDFVVVSIFVNPLQFGPNEDFERYPRDTEGDLELLEGEGADLAFLPSEDEMYPPEATVRIAPGPLGEVFEGADRPGHFEGVCTVVGKLFNIVDPDVALFGQKDAQQVAVLKRMVVDLDFRVEIVVGPTVREGDGLALSSRNVYLSPKQREQALALPRSLQAGRDTFLETGDIVATEKVMNDVLHAAEVEPSYVGAVDPGTFELPGEEGPVLLVVAARVGKTRLIDNMLIEKGG